MPGNVKIWRKLYKITKMLSQVKSVTFLLLFSLLGTFISKDDTGVGAILGSAAFNIFVITAICCFFTSKVCHNHLSM